MNRLNVKIQVVFVASVLLLQGCQLTPAQQSAIANADYGNYPDDYEEIVKQYFGHTLTDPYSAHYEIGHPYQGYKAAGALFNGRPEIFGYLVKAGVNAKNQFGGYTGEYMYQLLIRNGQVVWKQQLTYPAPVIP